MRMTLRSNPVHGNALCAQGDTWVDRSHGLHSGGSQLGHGIVANSKVVQTVQLVALPGHQKGQDGKHVCQSTDEARNWTVEHVSCGMDHTAAVLAMQPPEL
jgi:hypothetical protein